MSLTAHKWILYLPLMIPLGIALAFASCATNGTATVSIGLPAKSGSSNFYGVACGRGEFLFCEGRNIPLGGAAPAGVAITKEENADSSFIQEMRTGLWMGDWDEPSFKDQRYAPLHHGPLTGGAASAGLPPAVVHTVLDLRIIGLQTEQNGPRRWTAMALRSWVVFVVVLLPAIVVLRKVWVCTHDGRSRQHPRGESLCPSCGYDVRISPLRCPECGWGAAGEEERRNGG
jgi:hypothetical protein